MHSRTILEAPTRGADAWMPHDERSTDFRHSSSSSVLASESGSAASCSRACSASRRAASRVASMAPVRRTICTISASRSTSPCSMAWRISARFFRRAVRHREQQRQRRLAFAQVVADVLAERGRIAFVVEQVVDELERGAQRAAEVGAGVLDLARRIGDDGAQARAGLEQLGGLVADHAQVVVDRRGRRRACSSAAAPRLRR